MASRYMARQGGLGLQDSRARSMGPSTGGESGFSWGTAQMQNTSAFYSSNTRSGSRSRSGSPGLERSRARTPFSSSSRAKTPFSTQQPHKSIQQRDPLFTDFVTSIPRQAGTTGGSSLYNRANLTNLKDQFRHHVQDSWDRRSRGDPAVNHDIALRTSGWSNYLGRQELPASEVLGRKHSSSQMSSRETFSGLAPRITVYHRSTLN